MGPGKFRAKHAPSRLELRARQEGDDRDLDKESVPSARCPAFRHAIGGVDGYRLRIRGAVRHANDARRGPAVFQLAVRVRSRWWLRAIVVARTAALWVIGRGWLAAAAFPVGPIARLANDYGDTRRYAAENAVLPAPHPDESRVVFIGDSITEGWGRNEFASSAPFFPGRPYVNRGIGGQITAQMLLRFQADVVALKPKAVVVLGGINDIGGHMGPVRDVTIRQNLTAMTEIASANGIAVVLASLLPVCDDHQPQTYFFSPARIAALNGWLKSYAEARSFVYLDYFSVVSDPRGHLRADLTHDGLHPNAACYAAMAPAAEAAVSRALTLK